MQKLKVFACAVLSFFAFGVYKAHAQLTGIQYIFDPNPGLGSIADFLLVIMKELLAVIGIWATAFIIIGGFQMVASRGNEELLVKAKKTILWAILGLIIAILSFSVIAIVQNLIGADVQNNISGYNLLLTKILV